MAVAWLFELPERLACRAEANAIVNQVMQCRYGARPGSARLRPAGQGRAWRSNGRAWQRWVACMRGAMPLMGLMASLGECARKKKV